MGIEIQYLMPLFAISFFAVLSIVFDALFKNKAFSFWFSIAGLLLIIGFAIQNLLMGNNGINDMTASQLITRNMLSFGGLSAFLDILFALAGLMTIFASQQYLHREYKELNEFYSLILLSVSGMMIIGHSNNLLVLFIGIEIMSLSFYILAGYFRNSVQSLEAALKYFLLGAFATGFLAYGIALIYGATTSLDLTTISTVLANGQYDNTFLLLGIGLIIIGLSFKVAAFPFHQWAPDVYHGSPTVVSGFMSSAGKVAALAAFIIIFKAMLNPNFTNQQINLYTDTIRDILAYISAATMIIGNLTALVQKNIKRMLAYSSVAHAGYLLMGIVGNNTLGWTGIVFYSTAYIFMQLGAFVVMSIFERNEQSNLQLDDYSGLSKSHPIIAGLMAVFMLSLAGIPPFAGFFGKYYLFVSAIDGGYTWLTIVAVIASIVSMYYYIGVILAMYFKEPISTALQGKPGLANISLTLSVVGLLLFGVLPFLLTNIIIPFF